MMMLSSSPTGPTHPPTLLQLLFASLPTVCMRSFSTYVCFCVQCFLILAVNNDDEEIQHDAANDDDHHQHPPSLSHPTSVFFFSSIKG